MPSRPERRKTTVASREKSGTYWKRQRLEKWPLTAGASCRSEPWQLEGPFIPEKRSTTELLLVDTNVLLEATDEKRRFHDACVELLEKHPRLRISSQVIREYLVVATRPAEANGLGLAVADALSNVREFRRTLRLLPEERPILPAFLALLDEIPCQGKRIHDAHLVATALAHRVQTIVTLNAEDFEPFSTRVRTTAPSRLSRIAR